MARQKTQHTQESPKQCPCGHKHFSWSPDDDNVFCWDCNKKYPLSECLGVRQESSSIKTDRGSIGENLFQADRMDTRRYPRAKVTWPVTIAVSKGFLRAWRVKQRLSGRIQNISAGGALICCEETVNRNQELFLDIPEIAVLNRPVSAIAKVIRPDLYCLDDETIPHGIGVRFTKIADADRNLISTVVSDYLGSKQN